MCQVDNETYFLKYAKIFMLIANKSDVFYLYQSVWRHP